MYQLVYANGLYFLTHRDTGEMLIASSLVGVLLAKGIYTL